MGKKIVIIGANDFQNPLILKAKEMGLETHVFAWKCGDVGERTADRFYPVSVTEKERILDICRGIRPDAVTTIASDLANVTVQYVAKRLGLPCSSDGCIRATTNKYEMRRALEEGGVPVPKYRRVSELSELDGLSGFSYPLIVKPTDRSGSRSITKIYGEDELPGAVNDAIASSFEKCAIVEEYLEGDEYSCECISYNGSHTALAVTRKFTTGSPHFIETGHIEPSGLTDDVLARVKETVFRALDTLGVSLGASHTEFKIKPDGMVGIIEIGSRMGGDCIGSHLVELSTGVDFVRAVVDCALGNEPDLVPKEHDEASAVRFVFGKRDTETLERIKKDCPGLLKYQSEIAIKENGKITDSSSRFGFYIVSGEAGLVRRIAEG